MITMTLLVTPLVIRAEPRSDAWITTQVSHLLRFGERLSVSAVHVDAGTVTLFGTVHSPREKIHAAAAVMGVEGVVHVRNLLEVVPREGKTRTGRSTAAVRRGPAPGPLDVRSAARRVGIPIDVVSAAPEDSADLEDDVIRRDVEKALIDLDPEENADIRVLVQDGVVWLTGLVPTWEGNDARLYATRSVPGVRSIINSLRPACRGEGCESTVPPGLLLLPRDGGPW